MPTFMWMGMADASLQGLTMVSARATFQAHDLPVLTGLPAAPGGRAGRGDAAQDRLRDELRRGVDLLRGSPPSEQRSRAPALARSSTELEATR